MLKELSKVERRYDAVVAVIRDGLTVTEPTEEPCLIVHCGPSAAGRPGTHLLRDQAPPFNCLL